MLQDEHPILVSRVTRTSNGQALGKAIEVECTYIPQATMPESAMWMDALHCFAARIYQKDQSYALCMLSQDQLARTMLPLGEYAKADVRALARQNQLPTFETPESQDICFLPGKDYRSFLSGELLLLLENRRYLRESPG